MVERVLITGTTRGLGLSLLQHYVSQGAQVVAVNRRRDVELEARYAQVRFVHLDVRASDQVLTMLQELEGAGQLPEVFILNAGINEVDNDEHFELAAYRSVMETNLFGVLGFVQPLTSMTPGARPRHVVAIGSTARHVGNPYGLGYHTSKRTLSACFQVLARMYSGTDLVFQHVTLGPVQTSIFTMDDKFPRWMKRVRDAFAVSPAVAARAIARFARTRRSSLHYPLRAVPLYVGMWLARALVPGFFRGRKTLAGAARRLGAGEMRVTR